MKPHSIRIRLLCAAAMSLMIPLGARATALSVSLDTAGLAGQAGSELLFIMTDGSGTGDGNNTASVSGVGLGGGSLAAVDPFNTFGGFTGDLGSLLTLTDNSPASGFAEFFTPGATLTFSLNVTSNSDGNGVPDGLFLYLTDPSGNPLPTADPTGSDSLFAIDLSGSGTSVSNYDPQFLTISGPPSGSVPEPGALALLAAGLSLLGVAGRRRPMNPR